MKSPSLPVLATGIFALVTISASAGTFTVSPWTGDADSGISISTNYTAVADFAGDGTRTINGVTFSNTSVASSSYSLGGARDGFPGFANTLTGGSNLIASDFVYSGSSAGNASLTLTNLIPGQNYVTTWYNVGFGAPGGRFVNIIPGDTGVPFLFDENASGGGVGNLLTYSFTAVKPLITFTFDAVSNGDSYHHYAMTNAGPTGAGPSIALVTPTYTAANGFSPFTPLSNDLLQTSLAGAPIAAGGDFTREGTGGAGILNNGLFSITGVSGTNPELASGDGNSSVLYSLDLSSAPAGYDISQIVGYGGWNDAGRDRQLFEVSYSIVGDFGFTLLGRADFNPGGGTQSAIRSLFDTALTGVDAIRIDFLSGQENGWAGYGEFDVVGAPTVVVPEPGVSALLLTGLAAFGRRRRS